MFYVRVGSASGDLFPWKSGHMCRLDPSRSTAGQESAIDLSLGGCISGDMTPPTLLRTLWPVFVIRAACSAARWSIHITTFLCLSPGERKQNHQRAGGVEANASDLAPLHTLDLSGGLDIVVRLGLPDADGLLCGAPQQPVLGHQCSPHTGSAHVHSNIIDLRHEGRAGGGTDHSCTVRMSTCSRHLPNRPSRGGVDMARCQSNLHVIRHAPPSKSSRANEKP
ncbi:hypothetical protein INR49_000291 [Caranx melampygus]|nr:hypothetical protein INR49_000291 [Caranx melampygus]